MTTTITAEVSNLPPDIIEIRGDFFCINKTKDGLPVQMSNSEMLKFKERFKSVVEEALLKNPIEIKDLEAFHFNSANSTFYTFKDRDSLLNKNSSADKTFKVAQSVANNFLGVANNESSSQERARSNFQSQGAGNNGEINSSYNGGGEIRDPSNQRSKQSNSHASQSSSNNAATESSDILEEIINNFTDSNDQIDANSLNAYTKLLAKKQNNANNKVNILEPIIIQDGSYSSHPSIRYLIDSFNKDQSIDSIFAPIHVGSYKGYQKGHWLCAALTRKRGKTEVVIYDSLGGKESSRNLAEYIQANTKADNVIVSPENIKHQKNNAIDCGIYTLNFIKTMGETRFNGVEGFLNNPNPDINIGNLRSEFANDIKANANGGSIDTLFGSGMNELERLKYYHMSLDKEKFVGVQELKKIHLAQLEEFRKNNNLIIYQNCDSWTFPTKSPSEPRYKLTDEAVDQLVRDNIFMQCYVESAQQVLASYGWELKVKDKNYVIETLGATAHEIPESRLAAMAESSYILNRKLYNALVKLVEKHPAVGLFESSRSRRAFKQHSWFSWLNPFS